jgi:hypothetical protein
MFELETATKAKLTDVVVLSQKNRQPDENPGAKLSFDMALSNDSLVLFDGALKSTLFTKNGRGDGQATLDGVAVVSDKPNLTGIGQHVSVLHWELELTGYSLIIDHGMGGKSNIEIEDCTLSNFRIAPKEGGTVQVKFDAESANVAEKAFGKLATLKTREIQITLTPPSVEQDDIEGADAPAPRGRKAREAEAHAH